MANRFEGSIKVQVNLELFTYERRKSIEMSSLNMVACYGHTYRYNGKINILSINLEYKIITSYGT